MYHAIVDYKSARGFQWQGKACGGDWLTEPDASAVMETLPLRDDQDAYVLVGEVVHNPALKDTQCVCGAMLKEL